MKADGARPGILVALLMAGIAGHSAGAAAADCPVARDQLVQALKSSVKASGGPSNGGFDSHQWASVVTRDGAVCAVAFSGSTADEQWPGSRVIAMMKANAANALSVKTMALSTANLYAPALPGGPLYGLPQPPAPEANAGDATQFGTAADPALGKRIGGIVVFGGGLALYKDGNPVGGLGVSGDSSCADHNVAWRVRAALGLGSTPQKDAIIYDLNHDNKSASGFGHAKCAGHEADVASEIGAGVGGVTMGPRPK
ncbi:MAG TPA: heme-binding protein [Beijerinckiaceae bacterium]